MYQKLQEFDIHWHGDALSIAMVFHLRRVSDLLYDCLLCHMEYVVLHCSTFFKSNEIVRFQIQLIWVKSRWNQAKSVHWGLPFSVLECKVPLVDGSCERQLPPFTYFRPGIRTGLWSSNCCIRYRPLVKQNHFKPDVQNIILDMSLISK